MTTLSFFQSDWRRSTPKEPLLKVQNRYFEANPANSAEETALLRRPGFRKELNLGNDLGVTLGAYYQDGLFSGDYFKICTGGVCRVTPSTSTVASLTSAVSTFTGTLPYSNQGCFIAGSGGTPAKFYVTDGGVNLYVYPAVDPATGVLSLSSTSLENNATVRIGDTYYKFTNGSVDTGTPDGTSGSPWLLKLDKALAALQWAINLQGTPGLDYSTDTSRNSDVNAEALDGFTLRVYYAAAGDPSEGNDVVTTVSGTSVLSWSSSTLSGGGGLSGTSLYQVPVPFAASGYSITAIESFYNYVVIAIDDNQNPGRFYWIEPGEVFVDPLNFATAESSPDALLSMRAINERLYLLGQDTVESWYFQGDDDNPFARTQGGVFNVGILPGTDCVVKDSLVFVSPSSIAYTISGSTYAPLADPSVAERVHTFQVTEHTGDFSTLFSSWSFDLDGHLFYALNMGVSESLFYDFSTERASVWGAEETTFLPQGQGILVAADTLCSSVLSDAVWKLDADYAFDDNADDDESSNFLCIATAGMPMRLRETSKCGAVYLTASVGYPNTTGYFFLIDDYTGSLLSDTDGTILVDVLSGNEAGNAAPLVTLYTSDDNGVTWQEQGSSLVEEEAYDEELAWRSLGLIRAPGRLFKIEDYGSLARLDGLDIR